MKHTARLRRYGALLLILGLVVGACSGSDNAGMDDAGFGDAASVETAAPSALGFEGDQAAESAGDAPASDGEPGRNALGSGGVEPAALQIQNIGRDIIFTADLTVAVTDVAAAGQEAIRIIEGLGGFLFGQQTVGVPQPQSVLTFKVHPADFQEALRLLGAIGEIRTQNVSADDVTERIVDLESRIVTAEASVERLRGLITEAVGIEAIATLENQLLQRETDLETMRGQLRTLRDRVDLATIVVTLTEALSRPQLDLAISAYPGHDDAGQSCPGDGGISFDEGDAVTVCIELTNTGDTPLTDFDLRDPVLELETDDFVVVFGDPASTVEPGQFLILAAEVTPERSLRTQTRATAAPVNADGEVLESRRVSTTGSVFLDAVDPGGLPGFGDGLSASLDFLSRLGGLAVLFAGGILPFLWLPVVVWLVVRWRRRRTEAAVSVAGDAAPSPGEPAVPADMD